MTIYSSHIQQSVDRSSWSQVDVTKNNIYKKKIKVLSLKVWEMTQNLSSSPYHPTTLPLLNIKDAKDRGHQEAIYLFRQISQK